MSQFHTPYASISECTLGRKLHNMNMWSAEKEAKNNSRIQKKRICNGRNSTITRQYKLETDHPARWDLFLPLLMPNAKCADDCMKAPMKTTCRPSWTWGCDILGVLHVHRGGFFGGCYYALELSGLQSACGRPGGAFWANVHYCRVHRTIFIWLVRRAYRELLTSSVSSKDTIFILIENLWDCLEDQRVKHIHEYSRNVAELRKHLRTEWL